MERDFAKCSDSCSDDARLCVSCARLVGDELGEEVVEPWEEGERLKPGRPLGLPPQPRRDHARVHGEGRGA